MKLPVAGEAIELGDVAQGACPQCGSRVYKLAVLEELETVYGGWDSLPVPASAR